MADPIDSSPAPSAPAGGDDLQDVIAAYESAIAGNNPADQPAQAAAPETPTPEQPPADPSVSNSYFKNIAERYPSWEAPPELRPRDQDIDELQQFRENFTRWAGNVEHERLIAREKRDADGMYSEANAIAGDYPELAADSGTVWLRNEYAINPDLQNAWDRRYDSQDAMKHARRVVNEALQRFADHAQREANRIRSIPVNEDREAVSASVRGASKEPPPARQPNINFMSDAEFQAWTKKQYGYTPRI
ncbi:hypothetical protein [Hyphomicrobium sp. D-2]|uniref:hypothetical protein n=1 Tax=Hyphomicrobium sp. D-2 TaxID=3041621 RepID=UPI0024575847|nr:hypothetical protein [Hyphomicrobium sp. D-2]MDH4983270.1 hypothetical protein [Hyphomicrobium sp. D-2]